MKSVMISIQPKWCEKIASGKKTVELRKTKPNIETPFKVYIYCTKPKGKYDYGLCIDRGVCGTLKSVGLLAKCNYEFAVKNEMPILSGKVIGEFLCDHIMRHCEMANADIAEQQSRVKREKILEYANGNEVYGWHISDLVIYDKPKELREFYTRCYSGCDNCKYKSWDYDLGGGKDIICIVSNKKPIERPPQSWCYVEGVEGE